MNLCHIKLFNFLEISAALNCCKSENFLAKILFTTTPRAEKSEIVVISHKEKRVYTVKYINLIILLIYTLSIAR